MTITTGDSPKAGMSRGPLQLMLLTKVKCKSVTPREHLITDMAFIFSHSPNLLVINKKPLVYLQSQQAEMI